MTGKFLLEASRNEKLLKLGSNVTNEIQVEIGKDKYGWGLMFLLALFGSMVHVYMLRSH